MIPLVLVTSAEAKGFVERVVRLRGVNVELAVGAESAPWRVSLSLPARDAPIEQDQHRRFSLRDRPGQRIYLQVYGQRRPCALP